MPKKSSNKVNVDMTGVESGGRLVAEGDYKVKVLEVEHKTSESSGKPMLSWIFEVVSKDGGKLFYNTSLQPQALFNLKNLLLCLGVDVPNNKISLDLDDLVGRECGVTVAHEMYDGKKRAKISDIFPVDEEDEEDDDSDDEGDEDDEEEDEEIDYSDLDEGELKKLCKERGIKVTKKDNKKSLIAKLEEADEEDEDDE